MSLKLFLSFVKLVRKWPLLQALIWRARTGYNRTKRFFLDHRPVVDVGPLLREAILQHKPFAAGKMGSTEANAVSDFLARQRAVLCGKAPRPYRPYIFYTLFLNSGVFPQTDALFDRFCPTYLEAVRACDALAVWDVAGEAEILSSFCKDAARVFLYSLDSYFSHTPWTAALRGKKVLVISPFVRSITSQYARRALLWDNPDVLPPFELLTLAAPLSAGLAPARDADWFAALNRMKLEMDALDYDVALIGAGAFSLPLAVHAKERGKVGIHLGGATQILFGVLGERWIHNDKFAPFIKDSWVRPDRTETPSAFKANENGCYW